MTHPIVELRRGSPAVGRVLVAVGAALTAGAIYLAFAVDPTLILLGIFALLPLAIGAWGLVHRIRIFDDGVEVWTFFGRTKVLFREAERLTYRIAKVRVRQPVRVSFGYYVGFVLRGGGRKAAYFGPLEGDHPAHLEAVRDRIANVIADRLGEALARGESITWMALRGSRITLRTDALTYRAKRFIGYRAEEAVPYSAAFKYHYFSDLFVLEMGGRQLFMESANGDNFYPGLDLFGRLVARDGGSLERKSL
jgi:hypothetical protein